MTIKDAILKSLEDLNKLANYKEVYNIILEKNYYDFRDGKTPTATISALLGDFIRVGDSRVKRIKLNGGKFLYYLSKQEQGLNIESVLDNEKEPKKSAPVKSFHERDLHKLLSSYLKSQDIYSKTIFHEKSKNRSDSNQKWIHPDMVGIKFLILQKATSQSLMKLINNADLFKITSYEIKKEINSDYELKKSYFQAVSNSSWSNFGYLVAFEINKSLIDEIERLSQSFGIGVLELKPNPYESKILFPSKHKELDFKTIDKLCKINGEFDLFIEQTEKLLTATSKYYESTKKEFEENCDDYFNKDSEVDEYCRLKNIPINQNEEE